MNLQIYNVFLEDNINILSWVSILLTTLGALILTLSLNRWMDAINLSITGLDASIKLLQDEKILEIEGSDIHREKGKLQYKIFNIIGVSLIIASMFIQLGIIHVNTIKDDAKKSVNNKI